MILPIIVLFFLHSGKEPTVEEIRSDAVNQIGLKIAPLGRKETRSILFIVV
jgi:hypothetical protein